MNYFDQYNIIHNDYLVNIKKINNVYQYLYFIYKKTVSIIDKEIQIIIF